MTDWAYEQALVMGCASCGDAETEELATALRKAKADGMREAAVYVAMDDGAKGRYLDSWADRIEHPSEQPSAARTEK